MKGHGQTPRFWYSENTQAFADWVVARDQILAKNPLQSASDKALLTANMRSASVEGERKPTFGDGQQDYMMQRYKNLALIQVSGTLVKNDSYWNRYYGLVSYDEIRRSCLLALQDRTVDGILAVMSTPGGSAAGADAMATFFAKADQVKPFYSFAETDMCSGGYYLGAPSREIYAQRAALVGSIGVIMVHMDILDMYKENGITPTVFRAGEFKALGSPYEHLDKKATANIQGTLNNYFTMFNEHVVDCRGFKDVPDLLAEAGEGRVFMAEQAKEVGLVDQVAELEDALEEISDKSRKGSGKVSQFAVSTTATRGSAMSAKARAAINAAAAAGKPLTEAQIAALAAGAELNTILPEAEAAALAAAVEAEGVEDESAATDAPVAEVSTEAPAAVEEPAAPAPAAAAAPAPAVVDVDKIVQLSTELGTTKAALATAQAEKATLAGQVEAKDVTIKSLQTIVLQAISHRQVALGFQPSDATAMTAEQQVELFNKLDADFKDRFKPGQVSRPTQAAVQAVSLSPEADAARGMTGKL